MFRLERHFQKRLSTKKWEPNRPKDNDCDRNQKENAREREREEGNGRGWWHPASDVSEADVGSGRGERAHNPKRLDHDTERAELSEVCRTQLWGRARR